MSITLESPSQPTRVTLVNQTDDTRYFGIGTDEGGKVFTADNWTTSQLDETDSFVFQTVDQKQKLNSDLPTGKGTSLFRFLVWKDSNMDTVIGGVLYDRSLRKQKDTYNASGASFKWAMVDDKTLTVKGSYKDVSTTPIWKNPLFWVVAGGGVIIVVGLIIWISIMAAKKKPGTAARFLPLTPPSS